VAVISGDKKVVILEHSKRRNIKQVGDITTKDVGEGIADMHGYGDNIVVVGKNGSCQTLNPVTAKKGAMCKVGEDVDLVRICEHYSVCCRGNCGTIDIFVRAREKRDVLELEEKYFGLKGKGSGKTGV